MSLLEVALEPASLERKREIAQGRGRVINKLSQGNDVATGVLMEIWVVSDNDLIFFTLQRLNISPEGIVQLWEEGYQCDTPTMVEDLRRSYRGPVADKIRELGIAQVKSEEV